MARDQDANQRLTDLPAQNVVPNRNDLLYIEQEQDDGSYASRQISAEKLRSAPLDSQSLVSNDIILPPDRIFFEQTAGESSSLANITPNSLATEGNLKLGYNKSDVLSPDLIESGVIAENVTKEEVISLFEETTVRNISEGGVKSGIILGSRISSYGNVDISQFDWDLVDPFQIEISNVNEIIDFSFGFTPIYNPGSRYAFLSDFYLYQRRIGESEWTLIRQGEGSSSIRFLFKPPSVAVYEFAWRIRRVTTRSTWTVPKLFYNSIVLNDVDSKKYDSNDSFRAFNSPEFQASPGLSFTNQSVFFSGGLPDDADGDSGILTINGIGPTDKVVLNWQARNTNGSSSHRMFFIYRDAGSLGPWKNARRPGVDLNLNVAQFGFSPQYYSSSEFNYNNISKHTFTKADGDSSNLEFAVIYEYLPGILSNIIFLARKYNDESLSFSNIVNARRSGAVNYDTPLGTLTNILDPLYIPPNLQLNEGQSALLSLTRLSLSNAIRYSRSNFAFQVSINGGPYQDATYFSDQVTAVVRHIFTASAAGNYRFRLSAGASTTGSSNPAFTAEKVFTVIRSYKMNLRVSKEETKILQNQQNITLVFPTVEKQLLMKDDSNAGYVQFSSVSFYQRKVLTPLQQLSLRIKQDNGDNFFFSGTGARRSIATTSYRNFVNRLRDQVQAILNVVLTVPVGSDFPVDPTPTQGDWFQLSAPVRIPNDDTGITYGIGSYRYEVGKWKAVTGSISDPANPPSNPGTGTGMSIASGLTFPANPSAGDEFILKADQRIPDTSLGDTYHPALYLRNPANTAWLSLGRAITRYVAPVAPATTYNLSFGIGATAAGVIVNAMTSAFRAGQSKTIAKPANQDDEFFIIDIPAGQDINFIADSAFPNLNILSAFTKVGQRLYIGIDQANAQNYIVRLS